MKRYAGLIETDRGSEVKFTGLEAVRRDWTELARRAQRELYERLFREQPVEHYLQSLAERLRSGELDEQLVYHKRCARTKTPTPRRHRRMSQPLAR